MKVRTSQYPRVTTTLSPEDTQLIRSCLTPDRPTDDPEHYAKALHVFNQLGVPVASGVISVWARGTL